MTYITIVLTARRLDDMHFDVSYFDAATKLGNVIITRKNPGKNIKN